MGFSVAVACYTEQKNAEAYVALAEATAKKLQKKHPDAAARLWRAQGMRILDAKKSKYYGAPSFLERAKTTWGRTAAETRSVKPSRSDQQSWPCSALRRE